MEEFRNEVRISALPAAEQLLGEGSFNVAPHGPLEWPRPIDWVIAIFSNQVECRRGALENDAPVLQPMVHILDMLVDDSATTDARQSVRPFGDNMHK